MGHRWIIISLAAGVAMAGPLDLSAQQGPSFRQAQVGPKAKQTPRSDPQLDVEELTPSQIQRAQEPDRPGPVPTPTPAAPKPAATKAPPSPAQPARTVACSGAFAKGSSHLGLATVYKSENVTFTEVDAPEGAKVKASVLFPKDPKRRLEVWWENEGSRSGTYLIVIGGQSTWAAPKGLKLGMQLAAIEKLNGRPFKIKGFDSSNVAQISDWQGGALAEIPGGCRFGVYLSADSKAPAEALGEVSGDKEFVSTDATLRAVKPSVSEILIGY